MALDVTKPATIQDVGAAVTKLTAKIAHIDISGKVDKVKNATAGNIPVFDSDGGLTNSTIAAEDFYKVAVPVQDGTVTYNGTEQSPCWLNYDTSKMTVSGETSAIDAGSHTAIFTLNSGQKWSDDSTAAKSVTWNIQKAASYIRTLTDPVAMVKGTATISLPVTTVGDGHFSASSDNSDIVIVSSTKSEVVLSKIETGTATIILSLAETDNYAACTLPITVTVSYVDDIYNIVFFKGDEDSWIDQCGNQFTPVQSEPTISSSTHIGDSSFCFYNWYDGLIFDDVTLGGKDFTIDFWYNYDPPSINTTIGSTNNSQMPNVLNVYSTNSANVTVFSVMFDRNRNANTNRYIMWAKYNIGTYIEAGTFAVGQWTHFAVVYSESAARLYIYHNGALIANYGGAIPRLSGLRVNFGNGIGNPTYAQTIITPNLCMQYIRVSDGIARWTENFTPPTAEDY